MQMINIQGSARTMIIAFLSKKYNVSQATLYNIIGDKIWQENELDKRKSYKNKWADRKRGGDLHNFEENENKTIIKN